MKIKIKMKVNIKMGNKLMKINKFKMIYPLYKGRRKIIINNNNKNKIKNHKKRTKRCHTFKIDKCKLEWRMIIIIT
jgi:hypothetical protein